MRPNRLCTGQRGPEGSDGPLLNNMAARTLNSLIVVFGGRVGFVALSLIGTSLVMRQLGPAEVGVYWLCLTATKIVTTCLADGLDLAVLRSVPGTLDSNRARAFDTLRAAFVLRMGTVGGLAAIATAFSGALGELLFKRPDYGHMLVLTGAAAVGDMLMRSAMGYFQAAQRFHRLVLVETLSQALRFAGVIALMGTGLLTATTAMCAYLVPPYASFVVGFLGIPAELRRPRLPSGAEIREVFAYTKWILLVMALGAIYERLDVMLLGFFRAPTDVGLYAPAVMLATAPELVVSVILTVLNPQVTKHYHAGRINDLVRQYRKYAVPIGCLAILGAMTLGGPVIQLIFGSKYSASILLFKILAVGTLVFFMITPAYSALLSMFAPKRTLIVTVAGLVLILLGGVVVVPVYGVVGTAVLLTCVRIALAGLVTALALPLTNERGSVAYAQASAANRVAL